MRTLLAALLCLALLTPGFLAQDAAKDGDKPRARGEKLIVAKVKAVDADLGTITVTVGGKERTFGVGEDTKIVGPRGGASAARLKDDRLQKGAAVTILPAADGRTAREVRLGFRAKELGKGKPR